MRQAAATADCIITCGAVSVGPADFIGKLLREQGETFFSKVAIKPGKPLHFARLGQAWFFGLPGNPVSAFATFCLLVQPALWQLAGAGWQEPVRLRATLTGSLRKRPGRLDFQRGIFTRLANGCIGVSSAGGQDSHLLGSLAAANCFIELPADSSDAMAGSGVDIIPFDSLYA